MAGRKRSKRIEPQFGEAPTGDFPDSADDAPRQANARPVRAAPPANRRDTGGEAVHLNELPSYVPNAVIAIEDRRFRSHFGVDPVGLLRAVAKNVFAGGVVEGGSTLTQQLAKNMFLTPERSLKRKVQ